MTKQQKLKELEIKRIRYFEAAFLSLKSNLLDIDMEIDDLKQEIELEKTKNKRTDFSFSTNPNFIN